MKSYSIFRISGFHDELNWLAWSADDYSDVEIDNRISNYEATNKNGLPLTGGNDK